MIKSSNLISMFSKTLFNVFKTFRKKSSNENIYDNLSSAPCKNEYLVKALGRSGYWHYFKYTILHKCFTTIFNN